MGNFITGKAEVKQSDINGKWYTSHNQLYQDDDGVLYLVPRNYQTDGYTIPRWLAWLGGGRMQWDIRPAIGHDFECEYHAEIVVNATVEELRSLGFVKEITKDGQEITVCKNLPLRYLAVRETTFKRVNDKFKRMMEAVGCIAQWRVNLMRFGVNFNIGWLKSGKKKINLSRLYEGVNNAD